MARTVLTLLAIAAIAICGAFFTPFGALAQPQCGTRDDVLQTLATRYQEFPVHAGLTANGVMLEVIATESGSTWSIIVTPPGGLACLVASGDGWRIAPVTLPGEAS